MEKLPGKIIIAKSVSGEDVHYLIESYLKSGRNVLLWELDFRNPYGYRFTGETRTMKSRTASNCRSVGHWDENEKTLGRFPIAPAKITSS